MQTVAERALDLARQKVGETTARLVTASKNGEMNREAQRDLDRLGLLLVALPDLSPAAQEECIAYLNRIG